MRKSKFNESQIVGILQDAEAGVPVNALLRKHRVSRATFFKWRSNYGGVRSLGRQAAAGAQGGERQAEADVRGPRARERRHQGCPEPKAITPSAKRQVVAMHAGDHQLPVRQACRVMRLSRAAYYRPLVLASRRDAAVIAAPTDSVARCPRWGSGSASPTCGSRAIPGTTSACIACTVRCG